MVLEVTGHLTKRRGLCRFQVYKLVYESWICLHVVVDCNIIGKPVKIFIFDISMEIFVIYLSLNNSSS